MCCFKLFIAGRTIKTAAALSAVVFLFCTTGCQMVDRPDKSGKTHITGKDRKRPVRKRAGEYSRIPGNYPANWQTSYIGN